MHIDTQLPIHVLLRLLRCLQDVSERRMPEFPDYRTPPPGFGGGNAGGFCGGGFSSGGFGKVEDSVVSDSVVRTATTVSWGTGSEEGVG